VRPLRAKAFSAGDVALFALAVPAILFLLLFFALPLAKVLADSFTGADRAFGHYLDRFDSILFQRAVRASFVLTAWTVVACLVFGFAIAYRLSTLPPRWAKVWLLVVTFPAWTAVLARLYAWTIVLGRRGPLNDWMVKSDLVEQPLELVFTRSAAILGLVHILLPYAVLILYASMRRIDRSQIEAAQSFGAGWWTVVRRVLLPATTPAIVGAGLVVLALALGNYVTPSVLGGPKEYVVPLEVLRLAAVRDWGGALAAGSILVVATLLLFLLSLRAFQATRRVATPVRPTTAPGGRRTVGTCVLDAVLAGAVGFLILPLVVVFPVSITPSTYFRFPPDGFSLRWYEDFFGDEAWRNAGWLSLRLAVSASVLATAIGLAAALAVTRLRSPLFVALRVLFVAPLVVPLVITSTALLFAILQVNLHATFSGLLIGHTVLGLPFAFLITEAALRNYDMALEDAAVTLGASRLHAFRRVTLPAIMPAVVAGALFAFIASWDDVVVSTFLGNFRTQTLPLRMLEFMSTQIRPTIAAISTLLISGLLLAMLAFLAIQTRLDRRRRPAPAETTIV
jgi:putative spermidine/putrescine transport system permease protein